MGLNKLLIAVVLVVISISAVSQAANLNAGNFSRYPDPVIPLMEPLPFPWGTIEGVWEATTKEGNRMLFSFEVASDDGGRKFLRVMQMDPRTNEVVAKGNGWIDDRTYQVRVGMLADWGNFMIFIGQYKNDKFQGFPDPVTMLTVRDFQTPSTEYSLPIYKILPGPMKVPGSRD